MIMAVTGHRPDKLGGWHLPNQIFDFVRNAIKEAFLANKPEYVLTGMALGVDQWAAEVCVELGIKFIAAIPCNDQDKLWPAYSRTVYANLLGKSHAAYVITPGAYSKDKMHTRNKWMVNNSHKLLAVWDGSPGGTASCVHYAQQVSKPIEFINLPTDLLAKADHIFSMHKKYKTNTAWKDTKALPVVSTVPPTPKSTSKFISGIKDKAKANADAFLEGAKASLKLQLEKVGESAMTYDEVIAFESATMLAYKLMDKISTTDEFEQLKVLVDHIETASQNKTGSYDPNKIVKYVKENIPLIGKSKRKLDLD